MNATKTREEIIAEVEQAIRETLLEDARDGANDYAYVRVWPDLSVVRGREASYCVPEGECFGRKPHSATVWSAKGMRSSAGFDDGVFEWEEVDEPADLDEEERSCGFRHGSRSENTEDLCQGEDGCWYRLTDTLLEEFDISEVMNSVAEHLEECEWFPRD